MKTVRMAILALCGMVIFVACSDSTGRYVDLNTGESVELVKDEETGLMVNAETKKPVRIYVDTETNDTIWGTSGKVINGSISKNSSGTYIYLGDDDDSDYKLKRDGAGYKEKVGDDYKKKVEDDGDVKIKDGDTKIKIDAETGETKVKKDD